MPLLRSKLALLLCLLSASALAQTTIHIPADQPTIQAGINAAHNGDTVLVSPGTYLEHIDFSGKLITVTSTDGPARTTIDGQLAPGVATVSFHGSETSASVLSGFTITGGGYETFAASSYGGIHVTGTARPKILHNTIVGNQCDDIAIIFTAAWVEDNDLTSLSNVAPGGTNYCSFPGGMEIRGASGTTIVGNTFENLVSNGDAGGITVWATEDVRILKNIFRNNQGGNSGGIVLWNADQITVSGNLFYGNRAVDGWLGSGGAIGLHPPESSAGPTIGAITNNTFYGNSNSARTADGEEASDVGLDANLGQYAFVNNIVVGNSSVLPAVVCGESYNYLSYTPLVIDHNDIINVGGGPRYGGACPDQTSTYGNISADPLFAQPSNGDFTLRSGSPAIDAGNNNAVAIQAPDLNGFPRIVDATGKGYPVVDLGAYEFTGVNDATTTGLTLVPSTWYPQWPGSGLYTPLTFTATLSSPAGTPTGALTIFVDGKPALAVYILVGSSATFTIPGLTPGVHAFLATYDGQGQFPATQSVKFFLKLPLYTPTISLTSSPNPSVLGTPVTFTVIASSPDNTPVAPITLNDGTTTLATLAPNASGTATFTTSVLTAGSHFIQASFAGDSTRSAATASLTQVVNDPNDTTLGLAASPNPSFLSEAVTFTATITSKGGATPSGSVNFTYNNASIGSAPVGANGSATLSYASLPVGFDYVTATYVPGGSFHTSNATVGQQVLAALPTSTSLSCSPNPVFIGATASLLAQASASGSPLAGSFSFTDNAAPLGNVSAPNGTGTLSYSAAAAGQHVIVATFTPTASTYGASTATCNLSVATYPLTITLAASPMGSTAGQTVTLSTNFATNYLGHQFTGKLTFFDGATQIGQQQPSVSGFNLSTATLSAGTHTITAVYTDPEYGTGTTTSNAVTVVVAGASTLATLSVSPNTGSALFGTPVTLTASVTPQTPPGPGPLTGTVSFTIDGNPLPPAPALANGVTSLVLNKYHSGIHQLACTYSGDANYAPSTCAPVTFDIQPLPSAVTITSSQNPSLAYTPVTFTFHVTINGQPAPAGTSFVMGTMGPTSTILQTDANGNATYTATQLFARTWDIAAIYTADSTITSTADLYQVVTAAPTSLTLSASPSPAYIGQAVSFTAAAAPSGSTYPTGVVAFREGATVLGTGTLDATGHATFSTSTLAVGTHTVTASYLGDTGFSGATSPSVDETILDNGFTVDVAPSTLSLKSGSDGTAAIRLGSLGNFSGPLQLTLGPPPSYASTSLSAATVTLTAGATGASTLTLHTMALSALRPHDAPRSPGRTAEILSASLAGLLSLALLPAATRDRRRRFRGALLLALTALALGSATGCLNEWYTRHTVAAGTYTLPITATDATGRSVSTYLTLTVTP